MGASDNIVELGWLILHEDPVQVLDDCVAGNMPWACRLRLWAKPFRHTLYNL